MYTNLLLCTQYVTKTRKYSYPLKHNDRIGVPHLLFYFKFYVRTPFWPIFAEPRSRKKIEVQTKQKFDRRKEKNDLS